MTTNEVNKWTNLPMWFYGTRDLNNYFAYNQECVNCCSLFYENIQNIWSKIRLIKNPSLYYIKNQYIRKNRHLKIDNKCTLWTKLTNSNIKKIEDFLDINGNFYTLNELNEKYNTDLNFLELYMIIHSIPRDWKNEIKNTKDIEGELDGSMSKQITDLQDLTFMAKDVYWILISNKYTIPVHQKRWSDEFPIMKETEDIWPRIYFGAHHNIRNVKIQSLQYKLICRIISCKKKLYDWRIVNNKNCEICGAEDSIQHFFIDCTIVKDLWRKILKWWNSLNFLDIDIYREELRENILFGFKNTNNWYHVLNYVIMIAKWYIYKNKLFNDHKMFLCVFLKELKTSMITEEHIYKNLFFGAEFECVIENL
jgi:hypothetical protein